MHSKPVEIYQCPVCQAALNPSPTGYQCQVGHSFDRARENYVNLLTVQQKHSREPGDSSAMLAARRNFLERGHYLALRTAVQTVLAGQKPSRLLDIGTGDGYYAGGLRQAFPEVEVHGIDISKTAVKMAVKRYPDCHFAVAGSYALPFQSDSFSHLLNIFAPLEATEAWRVLAPTGFLVRVSPGPEHLFGLKALLYAQPHPHNLMTPELRGFQLQDQVSVQSTLHLRHPEELLELVQMTPYAWKLQAEDQIRLTQALPLKLAFDVRLSLYQKCSV